MRGPGLFTLARAPEAVRGSSASCAQGPASASGTNTGAGSGVCDGVAGSPEGWAEHPRSTRAARTHSPRALARAVTRAVVPDVGDIPLASRARHGVLPGYVLTGEPSHAHGTFYGSNAPACSTPPPTSASGRPPPRRRATATVRGRARHGVDRPGGLTAGLTAGARPPDLPSEVRGSPPSWSRHSRQIICLGQAPGRGQPRTAPISILSSGAGPVSHGHVRIFRGTAHLSCPPRPGGTHEPRYHPAESRAQATATRRRPGAGGARRW